MDNYEEALKEYLEICTKGMSRSYYHLLKEQGHYFGEFSNLPDNYEMRQPKQCYYNSMMAAVEDMDDKVYCEGFAVMSSLGIPLQHAWVYSMELRRVIDYTWDFRQGQAAGYFGVAFNTDTVLNHMLRTKHAGSVLEEIARDLRDGGYSMPCDPSFLKDIIYEIPESCSS